MHNTQTESCPAKEFELFGFLCAMGSIHTKKKKQIKKNNTGKRNFHYERKLGEIKETNSIHLDLPVVL